MKIKLKNSISKTSDLLIVPVFKEDLKKTNIFPKVLANFLDKRQKNKDFTGSYLETLSTYDLDEMPRQVLFVGLGSKKDLNAKVAMNAFGKSGKFANAHKRENIEVILTKELEPILQEILESISSSVYDLGKLKKKRKSHSSIKSLGIITNAKNLSESIKRAEIVSSASELVKDLVNQPANIITSTVLANTAKKVAKDNGYKVTILSDKELKKGGWGGVLSVNQGSKNPAYCAIIEYNGGKKGDAPIVLIGKGMVFDAGGYSIKTRSMEVMQQDMAGAATVIGTMSAIKKLGVKKNVIGITPIAENMINENAYRPSDIITMLSGDTVEVTNTDAEGRLILADAIHHSLKFKPKSIVTIATLTGAVGAALGPLYCGIMGNDDATRDKIQKSGEETDDLAWPLPVPKEYCDKMKSRYADIKNHDLGSAMYAGTPKAAGFLQHFVGDNKWCHIDIGGTAFTEDPKHYQTPGATAHGLRLLIKYVEKHA
ncbi:hypothetical protein COU74_02160 [Candidatus Peregrinibacteria bacterium CG10_big_fil_rev_8_21_14_0_10_36_19]|nr:MAG: hypothetical protein COU74_02160 [Candidatus Peregrinibacteria bacterium CG10_big_fil_rev_8_21_14_0_10_36_19]